jgi:hypothetical protein
MKLAYELTREGDLCSMYVLVGYETRKRTTSRLTAPQLAWPKLGLNSHSNGEPTTCSNLLGARTC